MGCLDYTKTGLYFHGDFINLDAHRARLVCCIEAFSPINSYQPEAIVIGLLIREIEPDPNYDAMWCGM